VKITTPKRSLPPRPLALISPGYRSLTIDTRAGTYRHAGPKRCYEALSKLEGFAVYVNGSITQLRHTTGATCWQGATWRGRCTSMTLDGTKVKVQSLRGALEGSEDPFGDLAGAMEFLAAYGVRAGSMSGMGWALWRSTLAHDVTLATRPSLGRSALFGGRQEVRNHLDSNGLPRELSHMAAVDITGAYPHAMHARPYAAGLRRVAPTTYLDPTVPGIAEAMVGVDTDLPYRPLPLRIARDMIVFPYGYVKGSWSWCELAAAVGLGCSITVSRAWAPTTTVDLFNDNWADAVTCGRALGPYAGRIIKTAVNSTWGMFGMVGDSIESLRWTDDAGLAPVRIPLPEKTMPHAATAHIAAETAARVRVRMLTEGLYGDWEAPVHVDTDGIIVRASSVKDLPIASPPGVWRLKTRYTRVDIRAPQVFRYLCGSGCGIAHVKWHYVTAGTPPALAEQLFNKMGQRGGWASTHGDDIVLPSISAQDRIGMKEVANAARSQLGEVA